MGSVDPANPQPPYPLHSSIEDKLDPVYKDFYNRHIFDKQQVHLQPVAASRTSGILIPGGGPQLPVGKTEDFPLQRQQTEGPDVPIRVFTPEGGRPTKGWPVMVYYHGGGWVLGNIDTENTVCTNLCKRANCVVISVDYRYFILLSPSLPQITDVDPKDLLPRAHTRRQCTTPGKPCYGFSRQGSLSCSSTPQKSP